MGRITVVSAIALIGLSAAAQAQRGYDPAPVVSRADVALGYNYIRANAPPGGDPKFNANGGFASVGINWKYWLSIAGEVSGTHANDISAIGQNLTLLTYAGGPRLMFHAGRSNVFVQGLVGAAHGSDSYFPTSTGYITTANSLAYSAGGGLDYGLSHRWAVRVQGQYLHTAFPNGVNDSEHHLSIGVGLVYRIHDHFAVPRAKSWAGTPAREVAPAAVPEPAPAAAALAPVQAPLPTPSDSENDNIFHENVKDIFFDYDSSTLRPDAREAVAHAADYLKFHPEIHVLIGGYSDERGTTDYNLSLGDKRAAAVRDALIAAGLDAGRLSVVSYGKGVQVCTQDDEACWQRNRRAAFMLHP